jgi:nitrate reductase NapAB chaperone NapD
VNSKFADDLNAKDAVDALTSFYNMQIIKYIDRIVVDKDVVEFNDSNSIEQYIKIIENLPADVNNAVLVYANEMQNLFSDALKQFNINLQTFPNI